MSDFKREERYIVVKLKDIDQEETEALHGFIKSWQIPTRECVAVEPDWPNYEDTWQAIEDVANDKYKSPYELIEQQQARICELEQLLRDSAKSADQFYQQRNHAIEKRDELVATVERLREVINSERKSLMVRVDAEKILQSTPHQNLNAIKLNALLDFRHDCGSMNGYNAVDVWDKMDEYIKREFG